MPFLPTSQPSSNYPVYTTSTFFPTYPQHDTYTNTTFEGTQVIENQAYIKELQIKYMDLDEQVKKLENNEKTFKQLIKDLEKKIENTQEYVEYIETKLRDLNEYVTHIKNIQEDSKEYNIIKCDPKE